MPEPENFDFSSSWALRFEIGLLAPGQTSSVTDKRYLTLLEIYSQFRSHVGKDIETGFSIGNFGLVLNIHRGTRFVA